MHRLIRIGIITFLLSPAIAWSQEPPSIAPGSRIRITELGVARIKLHSGTVVKAGADTVVLRLDRGGETVPFPLAGISQIELSEGRKGHAATGAKAGFLVGAVAIALAAVATYSSKGWADGSDNIPKVPATLVWAGIGGVTGMVVGGIVGACCKTERWEVLPSSPWHVSAWPVDPSGFALALSVRF